MVVHPTADRAYVSNVTSHDLSVVDTSTNTVLMTVPVGQHPHGLALTPDGSRLYVANSGDATVSIIDTTTNSVVNSVGVGANPQAFGVFIDRSSSPPACPSPGTPITLDTRALSSTHSLGAAEQELHDLRLTIDVPDDPCGTYRVRVLLEAFHQGGGPPLFSRIRVSTAGAPNVTSEPLAVTSNANSPSILEIVGIYDRLRHGSHTFSVFVQQGGSGPTLYLAPQSRAEVTRD